MNAPTSRLREYPFSDEGPHKPSGHPNWQESIVCMWWDDKAGIGGFHRIGHELGGDDPHVGSWNSVCTRDGERFLRTSYRPVQPGDRIADGFACAPLAEFGAEPNPTFKLDDPDCALDLSFSDFTPRTDLFPDAGGTVKEDFASNHFEVAGTVTGTARIGETTHQINGLAYRDHSWGKREWNKLLSHRWVAGSVGPELTFCAIGWHGVDDSLMHFGFAIRDGQVSVIHDIDIVAYIEVDGMSCRGGDVHFSMPDGERVHLHPVAIDGALSYHHGTAAIETICTVEHGGKQGFCCFQVSNNPCHGTRKPSHLLRANDTDGLTRRG